MPPYQTPQGTFLTATGTVNPKFYENSIGQAVAAANERAEQEKVLRAARHEAIRQSQIVQVGSQVLTPEERQANRESSEALLSVINSSTPLVKSGVIGMDTVGRMATAAVENTYSLRRKRRMAEREVSTLAQYARGNKNIDLKAVDGGISQLRKLYPESLLITIPGWSELTGKQSEIESQRSQAKAAYASRIGVTPDRVTWDYDNNTAVLDQQVIRDQVLAHKASELPKQWEIDSRKVAAQAFKPQRPERWRYSDTLFGGAGNAQKLFEKDLSAYREEYKQWVGLAYGKDSSEYESISRNVEEHQPAGSKLSQSQDGLVDATPRNIEEVHKLVLGGRMPEGVYVGLDGNRYSVTAE